MTDQPIPGQDREKLPRSLGVWAIWMLVVNGLIGAGIFGLPGGATRLAGEYSVWIYLLCAILILPIILCFAELGSYYRGTGGPIRYGTEAFGKFIGFQGGWLYYLARLISFAANSVLLVDSIGYFFPGAASGSGRLISLALICGILTFLNIIGAIESIRSLAVFTIIKFAVLIGLVFTGLVLVGTKVFPTFNEPLPPVTDLGSAAILLIYAYVGFEGAVVPAGEARKPERDMPIALLLGLGIVAALYMLIQLVSQAAVPDIAGSETPLLDVAAALLGDTGAVLLMIGVVASVGGNLTSAIFTTPRITYALSLMGTLPRWFGAVNPRFNTPANSILFFGICAFTGAALGSFTFLAAMTVLARLFLYIMSCAAIPVLRPGHRKPGRFINRGGYTIPVLGIVACFWLMWQVSFTSVWMTAAFVAGGSLLFLVARRGDSGSGSV